MERLRFTPSQGDTADPDVRMLSHKGLEEAVKEGKARG
jgi:hypothetical protein